jgi:hypothetical protein
MAIGVRYYSVYFLAPPTPAQVVAGLHAQTGLSMGVVEQLEDHLTLVHPDRPTWRLDVEWSMDRLATVPRFANPPFPNYSHSISLLVDPRRAPRCYQYLETALLLVLQGFDGQLEHPRPLPRWAGMKWAEMPPLGIWGTIKDYWR